MNDRVQAAVTFSPTLANNSQNDRLISDDLSTTLNDKELLCSGVLNARFRICQRQTKEEKKQQLKGKEGEPPDS